MPHEHERSGIGRLVLPAFNFSHMTFNLPNCQIYVGSKDIYIQIFGYRNLKTQTLYSQYIKSVELILSHTRAHSRSTADTTSDHLQQIIYIVRT